MTFHSNDMGRKGYILIQDWMLDLEGLSLTDIAVFAIIYGFSQDGESTFRGSQQWLADKIKVSRPTIAKSLKTLIERGCISKKDVNINGVKFCHYKATFDRVENNFTEGCKESLHKNKDINKNSLISSKDNIRESRTRSHFVPPTIEEINDFVITFGLSMDGQQFFDYYTANGWKVGKNAMKDWKAACRNWAARQRDYEGKRKVAPKEKEDEGWFAHNLRVFDKMNGTDNYDKLCGHE